MMFDKIKKVKIKVLSMLKTVIYFYKRSNGFGDFVKKGYRYFKKNGLHFEQLYPIVFVCSETEVSSSALFFQRFPNLISFPTIQVTSEFRINLVTDSLAENGLFGGVSTSVVFAILLANYFCCPLRVITRDSASSASVLLKIAQLNQIKINTVYEVNNFNYAFEKNPKYRLPVSESDLFVATSWWSAWTIREVSRRKKYIYLIQEYEKIFYPNGDEHRLIDKVFFDEKMIPVINTDLLYQFFKENNYQHIANNGISFEPTFLSGAFKKNTPPTLSKKDKKKFNLFFYSRPNVPKNLFYTGLELIETAVVLGIINPDEWEFFFAGTNSRNVVLAQQIQPKCLGKLTWPEYLEFLGTIDLGISLMVAPTPSYPPIDVAVAGGVALTNQYANKKNLDMYSKNIICSELNMESLLKNLELAVALVKNPEEREKNFAANTIVNHWEQSFLDVLPKIEQQIK